MTILLRLFCAFVLLSCPSWVLGDDNLAKPLELASPNGQLGVALQLSTTGQPAFEVKYRETVVVSGTLGLEFAGSGPLREKLKVVGVRRASRDETYAIPVGKAS